jgi:internalin A
MTYQAALQKIEQAGAEQWEELDLSGMGLTELPPEIGQLGQLKRLFLGKWDEEKAEGAGNQLTVLPEELGRLEQLEALSLHDNKIAVVPELIAKLTNLAKLSLARNKITEIPSWFSSLTSLTELELWENQISVFPESIAHLTNLTTLKLSANQISEIPDWIGSLTSLTELELSENQITTIPTALAALTNLTKLYLGKTQITEIPNWIGWLTNLTELSLQETQISEIPDWIAQLTNLTKLYLAKNQISEIPDWIGSLTNLTELHLWENQITVLASEIAQLTSLTKLYFWKNQISEIPDWIGSLTNLTELHLSENQITVLPSELAQLTNLAKLDLSNNQISEVPHWIGSLINLTRLGLWGNQITVIPSAIAQLTSLTKFNIGHNQISEIPDSISQLVNLTDLRLTHNQISKIPDSIFQLENLTILRISQNKIPEIPQSIGKLKNLTVLKLSANLICEIPESVVKLVNLTDLTLWSNQISVIPEEIGSLTNLQTLDLSRNQISVIPEEIGSLTNLQTLDLSRNQISVIPEEIGSLTNLTELYLSETQITVLPSVIAQLISLTKLYLSRNQISEIPDWISSLTNLTELRLSENQIIVLPSAIAQLTSLTTLSLSKNQISEVPDWIGSLTNLTELYLYENQITVMPRVIAQLTSLTKLNLAKNQISEIPDWISSLTNLTELYLYENQITVLPSLIAQLTSLTKLGLWKNQISEIPKWIGDLQYLELLDLSNNQIRELPQALQFLEKLNILRLSNNPLSIPSETLRQGWGKTSQDPGNPKAILDYYFTTRDPEQTSILYEAKLLLVGEGGSGKTSLANKFLKSDYQLKPESEDTSTEGIDILDWEFTGTNGQPYKIHIWDFGGQEIYHQTHQFFLTERACYLLVADSRKENTDHYFWFQSIQLLGKSSPVHLIQNEKNNRNCNLNIKQLRGEFENLRESHRINLADNRGLEDLQPILQHELEKLIATGIPFPNKWLAVRYSLENDSRNYIDHAEYEIICRQHGITNRDQMDDLSRFLHELGICLHFQKNSVLRNFLILKPNWGTAAVYKILDNATVRQNLGQFTDTDLDNIWAEKQYADKRFELLQLMKQFKVCYEIPRRKSHYIAPHLLSSESPTAPWNSDQNLILRYDYKNFMPKGILTRFIVEMHGDIENVSDPENALVWKTGVILISGTTRAEITEYYHQRKIHIRVSGPRPRDFLTIINRKFTEIHHEFYDDALCDPNPPFATLIPCNCSTCKSSLDPYLFPLDRLHTYIDRNHHTIQCYESSENVRVRGLIDGVIQEDPCDEDRNGENRYDEDRDYSENPTETFSGEPDYDRSSRKRSPRSRPKAQPPIIIENHIHNTSQQEQTMTEESKYTNDLKGANIANFANEVKDNARQQANQHNYAAQPQDLAQAAKDIKALIDQLATDYDTTTPAGKRSLSNKILETLEGDSTIQKRALNALKEAGKTAFEEAIDHPIAKVLVAGLEGYLEG